MASDIDFRTAFGTKRVFRDINIHICVCVKIECRKQGMMQKVFWIQEIFNHHIKRIPVIEVS